MYEVRSRGGCASCGPRRNAGRSVKGASARVVQGSGRGVLYHPIGDGIQGLRSHGLLNAAVFGGRARRAVLEEVVQARQFRGLKILVAAVLQGFLGFSRMLRRSDLKVLCTLEG